MENEKKDEEKKDEKTLDQIYNEQFSEFCIELSKNSKTAHILPYMHLAQKMVGNKALAAAKVVAQKSGMEKKEVKNE